MDGSDSVPEAGVNISYSAVPLAILFVECLLLLAVYVFNAVESNKDVAKNESLTAPGGGLKNHWFNHHCSSSNHHCSSSNHHCSSSNHHCSSSNHHCSSSNHHCSSSSRPSYRAAAAQGAAEGTCRSRLMNLIPKLYFNLWSCWRTSSCVP
jgi:hypothetical protein